MTVLSKLNTLFRASARESAERITDANALRIYRQEIIDAENLLQRRQLSLAGLIGTRQDLDRETKACKARIARREKQIADLPPEQRCDELLTMCARDIDNSESQLQHLQHRHARIEERINREEITLRTLLTQIREHRRELQIMSAEVARCGPLNRDYQNTVSSHLQTLRQTREGISGRIDDADRREEFMEEALERVNGDPLDRELANRGLDQSTARLAGIVSRLRTIDCPS